MPQLAVFVAISLRMSAVAHLKLCLDHYLLICFSIIWHLKLICISYCSVFSVLLANKYLLPLLSQSGLIPGWLFFFSSVNPHIFSIIMCHNVSDRFSLKCSLLALWVKVIFPKELGLLVSIQHEKVIIFSQLSVYKTTYRHILQFLIDKEIFYIFMYNFFLSLN